MVDTSHAWLIRVTLVNIKLNKKGSASVPGAHILDSADMEHFILDSSLGQRCHRIKQNNPLEHNCGQVLDCHCSSRKYH